MRLCILLQYLYNPLYIIDTKKKIFSRTDNKEYLLSEKT